MFSDTRRPQLREYLTARNNGADPATAAAIFGDPKQFARELRAYYGARKPYEQVTYPVDQTEEPDRAPPEPGPRCLRQGRLEIGRPRPHPAGTRQRHGPETGETTLQSARGGAQAARSMAWSAAAGCHRWSGELGAQLLLAEAECRSDNAAQCLAAAERAQALAPAMQAVVWKGTAMVQLAAAARNPNGRRAWWRHESDRRRKSRRYRGGAALCWPIMPAMRLTVRSPRSRRSMACKRRSARCRAPRRSRLELATALADRGQTDIARMVIMPVASGPYN